MATLFQACGLVWVPFESTWKKPISIIPPCVEEPPGPPWCQATTGAVAASEGSCTMFSW